MTGGQALVYDPQEQLDRHLNGQLVSAYRVSTIEAEELRGLLERHVHYTASEACGGAARRLGRRARQLLARRAEGRGGEDRVRGRGHRRGQSGRLREP